MYWIKCWRCNTLNTYNNPTDQQCRWFLYCTNPATHTVPHPVLGSVPCCERCWHMANGNR